MTLLKVDDKKCFFLQIDEEGNEKFLPINDISKKDILNLLKIILRNDINKIEIDEDIPNEADKIIYSSLAKKLNEVIEQKNQILADVDKEYQNAFSRYNS